MLLPLCDQRCSHSTALVWPESYSHFTALVWPQVQSFYCPCVTREVQSFYCRSVTTGAFISQADSQRFVTRRKNIHHRKSSNVWIDDSILPDSLKLLKAVRPWHGCTWPRPISSRQVPVKESNSAVFLHKYPTNTLTYVNTALCKLKQSWMFQLLWECPQAVLIHFVSPVKQIHVQMYQIISSVFYVTWLRQMAT